MVWDQKVDKTPTPLGVFFLSGKGPSDFPKKKSWCVFSVHVIVLTFDLHRWIYLWPTSQKHGRDFIISGKFVGVNASF